jgi:hypothetical protein
MIRAISLTPKLLAQAPHVELDFNVMSSDDWKGKRFNEIVPTDTIAHTFLLFVCGRTSASV